jgi:hypothetical protein
VALQPLESYGYAKEDLLSNVDPHLIRSWQLLILATR